MKKPTAIQFIQDAKISVPVAMSNFGIEVDYETTSSTTKNFKEHMSMQLAGEKYIFISEITENWDYVDEGDRASHMLSGVHNYVISSPTLNEHRDVDASSIFTLNKLDEVTKGSYGRKLCHDSDVASFHYMLKSQNSDSPELDKIFEMALATKVCAVNLPTYESNWNNIDRWADSEEWDITSTVYDLCLDSHNHSYGMIVDVPLTNRTYEIFREHIATNNPEIDMRVLDGFQSATKRLREHHEPDEARELISKLTSLMRDSDRVMQFQMLQFVDKSAIQVATHFIKSSYDKINNRSYIPQADTLSI